MLRLRWGLAQSFDRCSARIDRCPPARAAWPARGAADERHQRLAFAAACARHSDAVVDFWFRTMMNTKAEMTHRIACSLHLMNREAQVPAGPPMTLGNMREPQVAQLLGGNLAAGRLGRVLYWIGCLAATGWFLLLLGGYLSSTEPMPRGFWAFMIAIGAGI
jgi:hypothetical protein